MENIHHKNLLVTGGCGFIGSNFINYLTKKGVACDGKDVNIVCLDRMDYCSNRDYLIPSTNLTIVKGDINDYDLVHELLKKHNIDALIHFAAQTHVDNSFGNSIYFTRDNVLGTHTLLEAVRNYGKLKRFIHMSTDEVYGEVDIDHPGNKEHSLLNPTNPYAATKAASEFLVRSYYHSYKLPIVIVRGNNVYGPSQHDEKLIPKFTKALLQGKPCTVHGRGETRRNFIHADDVSRAMLVVLEKGQLNSIYNIGTNNEYSVLEILQQLCKIIRPNDDWKQHIEYVDDRPFNDQRYMIDASCLNELGWHEEESFTAGLESTVEWYRSFEVPSDNAQ